MRKSAKDAGINIELYLSLYLCMSRIFVCEARQIFITCFHHSYLWATRWQTHMAQLLWRPAWWRQAQGEKDNVVSARRREGDRAASLMSQRQRELLLLTSVCCHRSQRDSSVLNHMEKSSLHAQPSLQTPTGLSTAFSQVNKTVQVVGLFVFSRLAAA